MEESEHRALKRWERARQLEGLRKEPRTTGPLAWCRVRSVGGPDRLPVHLLALFSGDFAFVRAAGDSVPEGVPGPAWLVRGGIDWEEFLGAIVRHFRLGRPVPADFSPIRKLPSGLVEAISALPAPALPGVFAKLRTEGLLPGLRPLSRESCPPGLPWEDVRARFQDFPVKDNPPR